MADENFWYKESIKASFKNDIMEKKEAQDKNLQRLKSQDRLQEKEQDFQQKLTLQYRKLKLESEEHDRRQEKKSEELILKGRSEVEAQREITSREIMLAKFQAKLAEAGYRSQAELDKSNHQEITSREIKLAEFQAKLAEAGYRSQAELDKSNHQYNKELQFLNTQGAIQTIQEQGRQDQRRAEFDLKATVMLKKLDQSLHEQNLSAERFNTNALEESRHTRELETKQASLYSSMTMGMVKMMEMKLANDLEKDRFEHEQMTLLNIRKMARDLGLDPAELSASEISEMIMDFENLDRGNG